MNKKLVTGPGAGHPNVPQAFFLRFGLPYPPLADDFRSR
jgi:hypothetical protein